MSTILEKIYQKSPALIQNLMVTGYGLKIYRREYGAKFRETLQEFESNQWLSHDRLIEYQNEKLKLLIKHSYENVPYYQNKMNASGLKPGDIKTADDLSKMPILTRDDIKTNFEQLIARNAKRSRLIPGNTSGTTGSPLKLIWDDRICLIKTVVDWRQKRIAGLNPGDKMAFFLGRSVIPLGQKKPPFWRHNHILNHLFCSSWHLSRENLPVYFDKLAGFKPIAIEGYPSTISILAQYLISKKLIFPVKAVLTSSETLLPHQREAIETAFSCRLYDFYGMAERVVFATECETHDGKHLNMDFSIVEVLSKDGAPTDYGSIGRIVATGLHNFAMPLIRYQTSDVTALREAACSCKRGFTLMENITTKDEDIVSTKDGRYISPSILNALTHHLTSIFEHQVVQDENYSITLKIVKKPEYSDADHAFLYKGLKEIFGEEMKVAIEYVDNIPRTSAGKFRWVISKVPLGF
jgi:phenylacetate-CoA ligase